MVKKLQHAVDFFHYTTSLDTQCIYFDPLGQPKVMTCSDYFCSTCCPYFFCTFVLFKSSKTKQQKTMVATDETMGLAEWIIDDTCLVLK